MIVQQLKQKKTKRTISDTLAEKAKAAARLWEELKERRDAPDDVILVKPGEIRELLQQNKVAPRSSIDNESILKEKGIGIKTMQEMERTAPDMLAETFASIVNPNENKLTALHYANVSDGFIITISENIELKEPIIITTFLSQGINFSHLFIFGGKNSKATIIHHFKTEPLEKTEEKSTPPVVSASSFTSAITELDVQEGSNIEYAPVQTLPNTFHVAAFRRGQVQRSASLNFITGDFGGANIRTFTEAHLQGEGSESTNYGFFFGKDAQNYTFYSNTVHDAKNTTCDMAMRGALDDKAQALYRGLIKIPQHARNTRGYQKVKTMLLSKDAIANAIPSLQIDNCDVRASHEATVGQIDKEKLFYMRARGLNEEEARALLVKVFFAQTLQLVKNAEVKSILNALINQEIGAKLITTLDGDEK